MTISYVVSVKCAWCGKLLDRRSITQNVYFDSKECRKAWRAWKRKSEKKKNKA